MCEINEDDTKRTENLGNWRMATSNADMNTIQHPDYHSPFSNNQGTNTMKRSDAKLLAPVLERYALGAFVGRIRHWTHAEALHIAPLMAAYGDGENIQFHRLSIDKPNDKHWEDSDTHSFEMSHEQYRVAPKVTYRPWKLTEVPLLRLVRWVDRPGFRGFMTIRGCNEEGNGVHVQIASSWYSAAWILDRFCCENESPCGVREEQ